MPSIDSKSYWEGGFLQSPSEETLIHDPLKRDSKLPSEHDFLITSRPVPSSLLSLEKTAKINISCMNCVSLGKGHMEKSWRGIILGRHAAGSFKALLVRINIRHTDGPLLELVTICAECCSELKLHDRASQMDRIIKFEGHFGGSKMMRMRATHEEVEELLSTKAIAFMGMSITPFRAQGSDGEWKEWNRGS
jgi:hypothetical protein